MFAWKGKRDTSMRISVVIPAHNEASTLSQVLVEVEKLEPYEIIVVDNGSTDGTKEVVVDSMMEIEKGMFYPALTGSKTPTSKFGWSKKLGGSPAACKRSSGEG